MPEHRNVTINYHHFADQNGAFGGRTLEQLVKAAMETTDQSSNLNPAPALKDNWASRSWKEEGVDEVFLMNNFYAQSRHFYGDLLSFTRTDFQAVVDAQASGATADVSQFPPPDGQAFVRGILHFVLVGNHAFIIQDKAMRANRLEDYLNWLIRRKTRQGSDNAQIYLDSKVDLPEGAALSDIQKIEVGGLAIDRLEAAQEDETDESSGREMRRPVGHRTIEDNAAKRVLKNIFNDQTHFDQLVSQIPKGATLEVNVSFGYRETGGRRKKVSDQSLQRAFRHLPEGQISAYGPDGKLHAHDMRLSQQKRVQLLRGSLLNPREVIRASLETYRYFVTHGKIAAVDDSS